MIRATEFRLSRIQASAFFAGQQVRPARLLVSMPSGWTSVYDGDPVSLPIPPDAPAEIPSVILSSTDRRQAAQISRARLDLIRDCEGPQEPVLATELSMLATRLVELLDRMPNVQFGRLAAIVARIAERANPGIALAQQFCQERWLRGPLNRPEGFELHAHKVFDLSGSGAVNSWMRIRTVKLGNEPFGNILVEQDINTPAEEAEARRFTSTDVTAWYDAAAQQFDQVLSMYFPNAPSDAGV